MRRASGTRPTAPSASGRRASDRTLRAALWMTGSIVSFSAMAVAGREVRVDHDTFELMFYRSLVGVVIVVVA